MLDQIEPAPEIAHRVDDLLAELGSASFADRRSRQLALRQLGRPAILPLLRCDPSSLSPEQADRVHELLTADDWQPIDADASTAKKNLGFLLDCLDDDDAAIRAAARRSAETLIGTPLTIDLGAEPRTRSAAVDALSDQLRDAIEFKKSVGGGG